MSNANTTIKTLNASTQGALAATAANTRQNFGVDTSCTTGMRSGVLVSGPLLVAQAAFRRLTTPRGMLYGGEAEADYGLDLLGIIGTEATPNHAAAAPGQIQAELLKDPRIQSVTATVSATTAGPVTTWVIDVQAETADGPFALVLSVDGVSVQLLGVSTGISG